MDSIIQETIEVEFEKQNPSVIRKFLERNKQLFQLGIILALIFLFLEIVHIFIPKHRPVLVPLEQIENSE